MSVPKYIASSKHIMAEKKIAQADEKDEKAILDEESVCMFREKKSTRLQFNVKPIYDALGQQLFEEEKEIALGKSFP